MISLSTLYIKLVTKEENEKVNINSINRAI